LAYDYFPSSPAITTAGDAAAAVTSLDYLII